MKHFLIFVAFIFGSTSYAQKGTYIVLDVRGNILCENDSLWLKPEKKIMGEHSFYSASLLDLARLWNIEKKTYAYITPNNNKADENGWFSNGILTSKEYADYTANRGSDDEISYLFTKDKQLLYTKEVKVFLQPKDALSHYFLEFECNGDIIQNPLMIHDKVLTIDTNTLKSACALKSLSNSSSYAKIGYFDGKSEKRTMLKGIVYVLVAVENIAKELGIVKQLLLEKGGSSESVDNELKAYLEKSYGTDISLKDF